MHIKCLIDLSPCIHKKYMSKNQDYSSVGYKLPTIPHNMTMIVKMISDDSDYI